MTNERARQSPPDVGDLMRMHGALIDDVRRAARAKQKRSLIDFSYPPTSSLDASERRTFVKAVFAYIDAMTYALKVYAVETAPAQFGPGEHALALEHRYEVASNGEVEERTAKIKTLSNTRFAFRMIARAWSIRHFELNVAGTGWKAVAESIKVRDRLTHPRRFETLHVSDAEAEATKLAFDWFVGELMRVLETKYGAQMAVWKAEIAASSARRDDAEWNDSETP